MATVVEMGRGNSTNSSMAANSTWYQPLGDTQILGSGTESRAAVTRRTAGTFGGLYLRVLTNTVTATTTVRFRVNAGNGNQTLSVASSLTGEFQDTTHSDTVTAGQTAAIQFVIGATGTSFVPAMTAVRFTDSSGNTTKRYIDPSGSFFGSTTTLKFMSLVGSSGGTNTSEAAMQYKMRTAGTLKNLYANCVSNTVTTATTLVTRINTANGAQSLSIGASTTGIFEDTSHTDSVISGTLVNYGISAATGGTGTMQTSWVSTELTTTNSTWHMVAGDSSAIGTAANGTTFLPFGGLINTAGGVYSTTESDVQAKALVACLVSNLNINVTANTVTAVSTLTFRKNGGAGNQSVSITASTSGFFEDATHTDTVEQTDEVNYRLVTGATGTSVTFAMLGSLSTYNNFMPMWNSPQPDLVFDRQGVLDSGEI